MGVPAQVGERTLRNDIRFSNNVKVQLCEERPADLYVGGHF